MNVGFCRWLARRVRRRGDTLDIVLHEPGLGFFEGGLRHNAVAAVHRVMTAMLARVVRRVWMTTPAWEARWRPYLFGRAIPFEWIPLPSNVPVVDDPDGIAALRERHGAPLAGYFGPYHEPYASLLRAVVERFDGNLLLLGRGSDRFAPRLPATGDLPLGDLSRCLSACDVMIHLYPDGVSTRRTTAIASLAHGKCIVALDGRFTEPVWRESRAVRLVPVGEVACVAAEMRRLLADGDARRTLADAARRFYDERFRIEHTVAALCASLA
jgi:hypothetical protein